MDNSFKNKNVFVIVLEVLLIVLGIGGITFATSRLLGDRVTTTLTTGNYGLDYKGSMDLVGTDLEPISDSEINIDSTSNVIRLEFSVRGVRTNDAELIYDVMLENMNIDCSLLNKYTKWNLYKNNELLSSGSFDPKFDGGVLEGKMTLTNTQEDLPEYNMDYDNYVLIIWISESCDDLLTCEKIDQSNIINSNLSMKLFIAVYDSEKMLLERKGNNDTSCANSPVLHKGMIPVYYENGEWLVASSSNDTSYSWYDYGSHKWANAVMVNTNEYNNASLGTKIDKENIVSSFVWVPRYKYKAWNVLDEITDSYGAYKKGIDIVFEGGLSSSGKITCSDTGCDGNNDEYLTHPAFGNNLKGIWVSKYEASLIGDSILFIADKEIWKNDNYDNYVNKLNSFSTNYNIDANSRIMNNLEWGAVTYLSHSKYGLCDDSECMKIGINDTTISGNNKQDTTTRNVYGIYDMGGSGSEYVTGNYFLGTALEEVLINESTGWDNSYITISNNNYILRGGIQRGLFTTSDIGMFDTGVRAVIVSK